MSKARQLLEELDIDMEVRSPASPSQESEEDDKEADNGDPSKAKQMTEATNLIIHVKNKAQKALIDHELKGQISDGAWENSKPWEHWKAWSGAEVVADGKLGVEGDLWAIKKRNYNFSSKELLDIIGKRMVGIGNMALKDIPGEDMDYLSSYSDEDPAELEKSMQDKESYFATKVAPRILKHYKDMQDFHDKVQKGPYNMSILKNDLKDIKMAFKTDLPKESK